MKGKVKSFIEQWNRARALDAVEKMFQNLETREGWCRQAEKQIREAEIELKVRQEYIERENDLLRQLLGLYTTQEQGDGWEEID